MSKLEKIKFIFYGEGYPVSNNYGLDEKGLGQWTDDTDWLIKKVEHYEKALLNIANSDGWLIKPNPICTVEQAYDRCIDEAVKSLETK